MPSSKTKFVDYMTVYPQQCVVSGYPNERNQKQALDLGFDIPEYGRAYVSTWVWHGLHVSSVMYIRTLLMYNSLNWLKKTTT